MKHMTRSHRGFTLVEMVMVIVIIGIISAMVAVFIRAPVQGYFDLETRAGLTDAADTALRRIGRDLRLALPNSIGVSADSKTISFLLTRTGGRYRTERDYTDPNAPTGKPLRPGEQSATEFDVLGDMTLGGKVAAPQQDEWIVVYNLGITGADASEGTSRAIASGSSTAATIALDSGKFFPFASPGNRFHVVESQVTYTCQNGALVRSWQSPPGSSTTHTAILTDNVDCTGSFFTYGQNIISQRWGLVSMTLKLTRNNETVTLYHEAHVSNIP